MKMSRSNLFAVLVEKHDRNDFQRVGRVLVRFVELGSLDRGLLDARVLPWASLLVTLTQRRVVDSINRDSCSLQ